MLVKKKEKRSSSNDLINIFEKIEGKKADIEITLIE